jgi:hypothetical protein
MIAPAVFSFLKKGTKKTPLTSKYDKLVVPSLIAFPSTTHVSPSALPPRKQIRLCQVVPQLDSSVAGKQL